MYVEFLVLFHDYFKTLSTRVILYEWVFPIFVGITIFLSLLSGQNTVATILFKEQAISLLGILIGFSITIITILTTSHSRNLERIKKYPSPYEISGNKISLFRLLLINFTYSVIVEAILVILCLISPFILNSLNLGFGLKSGGFAILVFAIIHLLLLTIRNLSDLYFVLTKN